ncbi:MAG: type 4a pilus biogenesis protein PilO [Desulfobacter sp.]|nr:MAG: type 4a pilus biogenesis protein PilO [Desulfobacter sp.]|eukprot:Anaeramoba_ignava/c19325_g2_i1.p3 GENE.c19325_g2_i1~~c19325_g2_i1.p3  ORF type:complete len:218 (-),score=-3.84 c19325_g2_i1:1828-2481(-)
MADKKESSAGKLRGQMDRIFAGIGKLTKIQRLLICVGAILLIGGGYYYFIFAPRWENLNAAREELTRQEDRLATFKAKARVLPKFEKQMAEARERFNVAMKALPDKKELPALLTSISEAGMRAGLEFRLFEPATVVNKEFYKEIPISMDVSGAYHQIADFFFQVANLNRIVNVQNISMKKDGKETGAVQMKCSAVTYMFTEPKADSGKKSKRKKKRG